MVAGARLALDLGWEVRGSDMPLYPPTSELVSRLGVKVYSGYSEHNLDWEPDLVIIGNALSRGNVEVEETLSRRLPYQSLPEWLKENILRYRKPVAICGTHGKTTTTSLTAFLLDAAGFDNGFLVGGQMLDFDFLRGWVLRISRLSSKVMNTTRHSSINGRNSSITCLRLPW